MWRTQWSTMQVGGAPVAMFARQAEAQAANSARTAEEVRFPSQVSGEGELVWL